VGGTAARAHLEGGRTILVLEYRGGKPASRLFGTPLDVSQLAGHLSHHVKLEEQSE
jgi:hypothetical protein